jgi:hypothetical protein
LRSLTVAAGALLATCQVEAVTSRIVSNLCARLAPRG